MDIKKSLSTSSFRPQPSAAERAFTLLLPEIEALPAKAIQRPLVDVQIGSAIAHSVILRDREPERFEPFDRLAAADLYDPGLLDRIIQVSLAVWFTRHRQLGRVALHSDATVPAEVVRTAQLQRRRMMRVLDHWFDDDPGIVAELAAIRSGTGYQNLANDLEALADLYHRPEVHAVIQHDRKHYQKSDVRSARQLAGSIFDGLGLGRESEAQRWGILSQRAWTLLLADYEEHRAAGAYLFCKLEDVSETFPSLISAARRPPTPRPVGPSEEVAAVDAATPPAVERLEAAA